MTLIITDRPLEDFLEHIPPTKGPVIDEVHTIGGKEIHTRSDLWNPREFREHLVHGPLKLQRWSFGLIPRSDSVPSMINALLLEKGKDWFTYSTDDECTYYDMEQMLFVYWYLCCTGGRICIYRQDGLELLGPETPVARVDVSRKPVSDKIIRSIQTDILYLFFDSERRAPSHDTGILARMGMDPPDSRFTSFHAPEDELTLSGLRQALGNCYSIIRVYDHLEVVTTADRLRFKDFREAHKDYARPIEVIARTQVFADRCLDAGYPEPIDVDESCFDDCPVRLYKFNESQYEKGIDQARIQDYCGIDDTMSVIAIIDRGTRKRPIPELVFRDSNSYKESGLRIHQLHCNISPETVYGELFTPSESKDSLYIWVKLQISSTSDELAGLEVELRISDDMHISWNLKEHANGDIDLWCIDRMGTVRNPETESEEDVMIQSILDDAEGIQDESVKARFDSFVPFVAIKRVLTRAADALAISEPKLPLIIDGILGSYDRGHAACLVSELCDEVRVDVKGCIFYPDVDGKGPGIRVARRFGGKG